MKSLPWAWYLAGLRRFGLPVLLLVALAWHMLGYLLLGDRPVPQSPPPGYAFTEERVRLSWSRSDLTGPVRIQIVKDGGDFDDPDQEQEARGAMHTAKDLEPGTVYRWRVVHPKSGYVSPESTFATARYRIPF